MRDYGKVSPQFWIGSTGRAIRGHMEAQIVAFYLMTSPHANMIGVFHCPVPYIAHETGLSIEGASKGLRRLIEADFCTYEEDSEYVFVHQFAANQIGERLEASDKRCKGVENELAKVPKGQCWRAFRARYAVPFNLAIPSESAANIKPLASPLEAPSKPETGAGAEAGEEGLPESPLSPPRPGGPSMAGAVCVALKSIGMGKVNPTNQSLIDLLAQGAEIGMFVDVGRECVESHKPFSYLLATVKGRMADAAALAAKATSSARGPAGGILPGAI